MNTSEARPIRQVRVVSAGWSRARNVEQFEVVVGTRGGPAVDQGEELHHQTGALAGRPSKKTARDRSATFQAPFSTTQRSSTSVIEMVGSSMPWSTPAGRRDRTARRRAG
jgi:hypothetical protein